MNCQEILAYDKKFRYQILSRHQCDCEYFLGNGRLFAPHLWAGNVTDHIENMKALYNSFADDEKPEWLSWEQILEYERLMTCFHSIVIVARDDKTIQWGYAAEENPTLHTSIVSDTIGNRPYFYTEGNHCVFVDECVVKDMQASWHLVGGYKG